MQGLVKLLLSCSICVSGGLFVFVFLLRLSLLVSVLFFVTLLRLFEDGSTLMQYCWLGRWIPVKTIKTSKPWFCSFLLLLCQYWFNHRHIQIIPVSANSRQMAFYWGIIHSQCDRHFGLTRWPKLPHDKHNNNKKTVKWLVTTAAALTRRLG